MLPPAVIGMIYDAHGRLLTVSRPEPPYEMALPGGEVDPGEDIYQAFVREAREETGIHVRRARFFWRAKSPTDGRDVHVLAVTRWDGEPYAAEPGTIVAWLTPAQLVQQAVLYRPFYEAML